MVVAWFPINHNVKRVFKKIWQKITYQLQGISALSEVIFVLCLKKKLSRALLQSQKTNISYSDEVHSVTECHLLFEKLHKSKRVNFQYFFLLRGVEHFKINLSSQPTENYEFWGCVNIIFGSKGLPSFPLPLCINPSKLHQNISLLRFRHMLFGYVLQSKSKKIYFLQIYSLLLSFKFCHSLYSFIFWNNQFILVQNCSLFPLKKKVKYIPLLCIHSCVYFPLFFYIDSHPSMLITTFNPRTKFYLIAKNERQVIENCLPYTEISADQRSS